MIYLGIRHMGFSDPILILYLARSRLGACELVFREAIVRMALLLSFEMLLLARLTENIFFGCTLLLIKVSAVWHCKRNAYLGFEV